MRLYAITLGCQMSAADNIEMSETFSNRGFSLTGDLARADAVLISTCTVRQHAEDKALSLIGSLRPWKEERPSRILIVSGCAAERLGGWLLKRFPYLDLVVGAKSIEDFPDIVEKTLADRFVPDASPYPAARCGPAAPTDFLMGPGTLRLPARGPASAMVTIMRGCNYSCAYCIVPSVRGPESYRPPETVLAEVRRKTAQGAREVILLGQTVNSYRYDSGGNLVDFADLLRLVDGVPGLERLRFMSPHPYYIDDRMIEAMRDSRTVCESLHLPAQSGSDRILKLMRRSYTRRSLLEGVEKIRDAIPTIEVSTDIIVGFPTETEEDFKASLSLLTAMEASTAYCFKYSPRESTESAGWPDDVSREVKEDRLRRLNAIVDGKIAASLKRQIGADLEVLTERESFGRTRSGFRVRIDAPVPAGRLVKTGITGSTRLTLTGGFHGSEKKQAG